MISILVLSVTALLIYIAHKWYTVWQYSEQFPGQPTYPIIGNGHLLGNTSYAYLKFLYTETKRYQFEAFRFWVGHSLYILLTKAEDVEIFMSTKKHLDKFQDYRFLHDWLGHGLITENGQRWHRQRRLLTPAFHFKILNEFHPIMSSNASRLVEKLHTFADSGESFDAQHILNLATLDVICETAMGVQMHALDDPESELVQAFHDASYVVFQRIFSPWKRFDWLFPLSKDYQINKKACKILHSFNHEIIAKRRQLLSDTTSNPQSEDDIDAAPKNKQVFIDMLLTTLIDGKPMTDDEISDEVSTFIFAGHDTTAASITFGLFNMARYPKEQQRVYEEQLAIFGDDLNREPTYQELQEMKYTEMFIKESQRLFPAVPFVGRHATENIQLANGKTIPKGSSVAILLYAMGHNPKTFEDPMVFNPDRFLPENRENKSPYEYVPFSAGPRNCIGQKFAYNEVRTVIAKLVRHFEVLPTVEPFEPMLGATATLISTNGVYIRLKRRPNVAKL